ncbi:MAG: glycosyltransferase family 4 protein [Nodosilinea sp.]
MSPRHHLILSTPVGPLGSGLGGGVELTLLNVAQALIARGHRVTVVAPEQSILGAVPVVEIAGQLQPTAHTQGRATPATLPDHAVLANMWAYARTVQAEVDVIVNLAYDWLPFYLTPFFQRPVAHFVTMGSLSDVMDAAVRQVAEQFPGRLGAYTCTQAETFGIANAFEILGSAIDLDCYRFCADPGPALAWMGRISPEKGLEDALEASQIKGLPLKIMGKLEDLDYWQRICQQFPQATASYLGFLPTQELQTVLRECRALLMTPRWVEAFGNVAIEALACGVPVVAYNRGGPAEIVQPGKTGWLVTPDDVQALAATLDQIDVLNRQACRRQAEDVYSLGALGERFEAWLEGML